MESTLSDINHAAAALEEAAEQCDYAARYFPNAASRKNHINHTLSYLRSAAALLGHRLVEMGDVQ